MNCSQICYTAINKEWYSDPSAVFENLANQNKVRLWEVGLKKGNYPIKLDYFKNKINQIYSSSMSARGGGDLEHNVLPLCWLLEAGQSEESELHRGWAEGLCETNEDYFKGLIILSHSEQNKSPFQSGYVAEIFVKVFFRFGATLFYFFKISSDRQTNRTADVSVLTPRPPAGVSEESAGRQHHCSIVFWFELLSRAGTASKDNVYLHI